MLIKKPKKKKFNSQAKDQAQSDRDTMIYNQAIDEYEKRLPSKKVIYEYIINYCGHVPGGKRTSTAISKRIRGEK